jgi:CrcB protein
MAMSVASSPSAPPVARQRTRERERLLAAIFVGGTVGALVRAGLEQALPATGHGWPWATFTVNVAGTALLGYVVTRLQERLPPSIYPRPFVGAGLCGAVTTFATLQVEAITLARNGHVLLAIAYPTVSVTVGLLVVYLTTAVVRRVSPR